MAKLRRTLLVGLGGTGIKTILNAKKMFYENYGEIPPMIGFIGVDTDKPGLNNASVLAADGKKITLDKSEQLCISVDSPIAIYNRSKEMFDWLPDCNAQALTNLSIGAGMTRSNGRFAITVNKTNVESAISHKMTEINNATIIDNVNYELLGKETEVHMVFSLGGGTGCGTFLNMAYLIRKMYPKIKVSGYAVLADVFRSMVSGAMSAKVRPNAKGAIKDLDYLAHLTPSSAPVDVKWLRGVDSFSYRPFDALYLVDNSNENDYMFDKVDPLCEMIALAIVTSVGELGVALDSVSDNVSKLIAEGTMDIKDKKAWVASFGCSEIIFDGGRLAKIYARKALSQLINKMLNGGCDDPVTIANNWFDNNKIRENYGKDDVIDYFMSPNPPYALSDLSDPTNPYPECQHYVNQIAIDAQTKLDEKLESMESRIESALVQLMREQANRECGIYLCQQILLTILHQINLCDGEMKEEKAEYDETKLPALDSAMKTACNELKDCMGTFFKFRKKEYVATVVESTMAYATAKRESVRRGMARSFYGWLRERINKSIERIDTIIKNLQSVRDESNNALQKIMRSTAGDSFFQFDLTTDYAETVECPVSDIVFNDFARSMLPEGGIISMVGLTSKETEDALLRFIWKLPKVKEFTAMTIDDVLDKLTDTEVQTLISKAVKKSLPLLPYTLRGYDAFLAAKPVECYYIGVSDKKRSRLTRNNLFQNVVTDARDVQFSDVGFANRVIIYRQLGVIPAFTIKALDNYANEYEQWESQKPGGSHWCYNLFSRMTKERYSLDPKTTPANDIFEVWVRAVIYDMVRYDTVSGKYQIRSRGLGGQPLTNYMVDMGETRHEAYLFFEDNFDVLGPEIRNAILSMDIPGPKNPIRKLSKIAVDACKDGTYLDKVSKSPLSREDIAYYPDDMNLVNKEIEFILDNIAG